MHSILLSAGYLLAWHFWAAVAQTNVTDTNDTSTSTADNHTSPQSTTSSPPVSNTTAAADSKVSLSDSSVATIAIVSSVGGLIVVAVLAYVLCWCNRKGKRKGHRIPGIAATAKGKEMDERERAAQYARLNVNANNPLPSVLQMGVRWQADDGLVESGDGDRYRQRVNHRINTIAQFSKSSPPHNTEGELELSTLEQPAAAEGETVGAGQSRPRAGILSPSPNGLPRPLSVSTPEIGGGGGAPVEPSNGNTGESTKIGALRPIPADEVEADTYSQRSDGPIAINNDFPSADIPSLKPASAGSDQRQMDDHHAAAVLASSSPMEDDQANSGTSPQQEDSTRNPAVLPLQNNNSIPLATSATPLRSNEGRESRSASRGPHCCPYCGVPFADAPPLCAAAEGSPSHRTVYEDIREAKAAKKALQELLLRHDPDAGAAVTSALAAGASELS